MAFDLPRDRVVPVHTINVRLDASPHPFELANSDAIDLNWQSELAANPAYFDGRMMLLSALSLRDGVLTGTCHDVRYATLLHWRKQRQGEAEHAFAHAALVSSDGALVAIRMGAHTANPGKVYFAAGSFEPEDFVDGCVDVEANMIREVREETGLDISNLHRDTAYHLHSLDSATVIARRYYLAETADIIAERIRAFVANESRPEIEGPVIIRKTEPMPDGILPHMEALVRWHFADR